MDIKNNVYYKRLLKEPWPYTAGAILLGLLNITMLASTGKAWGITSPFANWAAWAYQTIGGHPEEWFYFQQECNAAALAGGFMKDIYSVSDIGVIFGALLSTLLASQFKIKKIKSWKQVVGAVLGGLMMGYGARIAFGCNIGALFGGVASMSLHGWVFWIFIFVGAWIGSKLLVKYFI
ncbi:MAG: YeeE/YedE thiosulfate transporter family protein [Caulobacteraceae bacterium]